MENRLDAVYVENKIKLSWPIELGLVELGLVYDENMIRQWCDRSYRYGLRLKTETKLLGPI